MRIENLNKWCYSNYDLIEEVRERNDKAVILISGASSSGKSYCARILKDFLIEKNLKPLLISTDDYALGISKIIFNNVKNKYYDKNLPYSEKIVEIIRSVTINTGFSLKLCNDNLLKISEKLKPYLNDKEISIFNKHLKYELDNINFDTVFNYDLELLSKDIKKLLNNEYINLKEYSKITGERSQSNIQTYGNNYDVIIVEGIYALNDGLIKELDENYLVKNFIDCDNKSLFIRRILRDLKGTSCDKKFIIKNYIKFVAKEYFNTVLPTKKNADFVLENNMSFDELRQGEYLETQGKYRISRDILSTIMKDAVLISNTIQKDTYLFCDKKSTTNILRLRKISYDAKDFLMESLIHKGEYRTRKDKKIIRPVNTIANKNELYEMFNSKEELINELKKIGICESQVITKQRIFLNYFGETIKLDKIRNEYYIELECIDNIKCLSNLRLEKAEPYFEMLNESNTIKINTTYNKIKEKTII